MKIIRNNMFCKESVTPVIHGHADLSPLTRCSVETSPKDNVLCFTVLPTLYT